ncbi:MAG TPA: hypothetical protein ENK62_09225 [Chromatiales bacterium]|nr:hypothetical protein [Chromatiales bacterium]
MPVADAMGAAALRIQAMPEGRQTGDRSRCLLEARGVHGVPAAATICERDHGRVSARCRAVWPDPRASAIRLARGAFERARR